MIVITTPTGQIGRQVLDRVLERATDPVRVVARDPARLPPAVRDRVEVVAGSTADTDVLTTAFAGADAVFWLVPPDPGAASLHGHVLDFVRPACEAIQARRVPRVVAVSSLGHGCPRSAGQISAIFAMDHLFASTGVAYRSLQPPGFMENLLRQLGPITSDGVFFLPQSGDRRYPACATRDIAAVAAELLLDPAWTGQATVPLRGPEDLSHHDMAEIMSAVLGRPVRFQPVPADAYRATLLEHGMSEAWAQGLIDMAAAVEDGIYDSDPDAPRSITPTTFRQWCEEVLRPAAAAA